MKVRIALARRHENACLEFTLSGALKMRVLRIANSIPKPHIVKIEDTPHVTLMYPMQDEQLTDLARYIHENRFNTARVQFTGVHLFDNPDEKALVLKVESPDLQKIHRSIKRHFKIPYAYKDYIPHVTLAYLRKKDAPQYKDWKSPLLMNPSAIYTLNRVTFEDTYGRRVPIIGGE